MRHTSENRKDMRRAIQVIGYILNNLWLVACFFFILYCFVSCSINDIATAYHKAYCQKCCQKEAIDGRSK